MIKVFISSTDSSDIHDLRIEVINYVEKLGYKAWVHEKKNDFFGCDTKDIGRYDVCLRRVEEADVLIVLIDREFGSNYEGEIYTDSPKGFESAKMSITWAETRKALELGKHVCACVRRTTEWACRKRSKDKKSKSGTSDGVDPQVCNFLEYLQEEKKCHKIFFDDSVHVKDKLGHWLDSIAKRISHSLITQYNSAFSRVSDIDKLLSDIYSVHKGNIWLFNNDLELIKDEDWFDEVYVKTLKGKLESGAINAIRIILNPKKYLEFENGNEELLCNFSKMGDIVNKIHISSLVSFSDHNISDLGTENISFYTIDKRLKHPDTICIIRKDTPSIFAGFFIICRRQEVKDFFEHAKDFVQIFSEQDKFCSLWIEKDAKNKPLKFELKPI